MKATTNTTGDERESLEHICEVLCEIGPWDEIDGDGWEGQIIADHMKRLVRGLRRIVEDQQKLLACYRTGGHPSGALLDRLRDGREWLALLDDGSEVPA